MFQKIDNILLQFEGSLFSGSFGVLGMTMVKFGKGEENSPVDFIAKRRAALERY